MPSHSHEWPRIAPRRHFTGLGLIFVLVSGALTAAAAEDELRSQGRVLIHQRNCGACHSEFPVGVPGPSLAGLAERLPSPVVKAFLLGTHSVKPGSRMPALLRPDEPDATNQAEQEAEALTAYLLTLPSEQPILPAAAGDPDRGRDLFRSIGCLACHAGMAGDTPRDGVPITLARSASHDSLVAYLRQPRSRLMPSLKLSTREAADLSTWIRQHEPAHLEHKQSSASPDEVAMGRKLFVSRRCIACHSPAPADHPPLPAVPAIRDWRSGCLAPDPPPRAADFSFNEEERAAIISAAGAPQPAEPAEIVNHFLSTHRCDSCHQRDGDGGPGEARRPFFRATDSMVESYGELGELPPRLDHAGRKLTRAWLRRILSEGKGAVRPYLATRMPHYAIPAAEVKAFINALEAADRRDPPIEIDVSGLPRHQRGHYGRDLMGAKGLNCITCHGLKGRRALGAPSIDLTHTVQRLRPAYFKELLLDPQSVQPGTLMPPLFLRRPKANEEIEQIWTYLKELDQRRLPDGLLRTGDFELKPAEEDKPIVFRTFLEGVGTHAVAVGYPAGIHLAFDAQQCRWSLAWKGRFLNAMSTWDDRYATPARPLSDDLYRFADRDQPARRFRGFRLNTDRAPVFLYEEAGSLVEDCIIPLPSGELHRTLSRPGQTVQQRVLLQSGTATFRNEE